MQVLIRKRLILTQESFQVNSQFRANSKSDKLIIIYVVQDLIEFSYRMQFERLNQRNIGHSNFIIIFTKLSQPNQIYAYRIEIVANALTLFLFSFILIIINEMVRIQYQFS